MDPDNRGIVAKPFVMFERPEKKKFLFFSNPVTSNAFENAGAIVEGVSQNAHLGVLKLVKTSFEIDDEIGINV